MHILWRARSFMRLFRLSRPAVFAALTTAAAAALLGCQQMLGASRAPAIATNAGPAFQRIELPSATVEAERLMPAATQSGSFEEAFRPLPSIAPNVTLAPVAGSPGASRELEPTFVATRLLPTVYES